MPIRDVVSVLGGQAALPCDILPEDAHDDVYLVLWFKDKATKPMYRSVKNNYTKYNNRHNEIKLAVRSFDQEDKS